MKKLTGVIGAAFLLASCAPLALADLPDQLLTQWRWRYNMR